MHGKAPLQIQLGLLLFLHLLSCVVILSFSLPKVEDGKIVRLFQRKKVIYILSHLAHFSIGVLYRLRFYELCVGR